MTVLALKLSRRANAVSALHGHVSREMWAPLWPHRPEDEVPIGHITNGVHVFTWLAPQLHRLYDRHLGHDWPDHAGEPERWEAIDKVEDGELWETHQTLKSRLLNFVRRRAAGQAERRGESPEVVAQLRRVLSLDALTIGFARRFATYKRADLVLRDLDQIAALVNHPQTPIQFVFAGKAHPEDRYGKELIQNIIKMTKDAGFAHRIVFVEDYDMNVARHLVQGVDGWLNNPRRPQEASGTSGEKALLNGALNFSVLDGWWAEAYDGSNGWALPGDTTDDVMAQDERDAQVLHRLLGTEVVPSFYERDAEGVPTAWVERMRASLRTLGPRFCAARMLSEYVEGPYRRAAADAVSSPSS